MVTDADYQRLLPGSKAINELVLGRLASDKGVHIESYLALMGAVAGYSCQMAVRFGGVVTPGKSDELVEAETVDGSKFYFGDAINRLLYEEPYSVWGSLVHGIGYCGFKAGNIEDIFRYVASTIGTPDFGIPRIGPDHSPGDTPLNYLKAAWPTIFPMVKASSQRPLDWPVQLGMTIQHILIMAKDTIDPNLAARICMECAVPMSKVNLLELGV